MYFFWYLGNIKNLTKINLRDIDGCFLIYNLDCLDDHGKLGSLLGFLKLLLGLAELSQVEGGNLLSLLNLLLVGLDLHLQLAGKLSHGGFARLEGNILSIRKTSLKFSKSIGKRVL